MTEPDKSWGCWIAGLVLIAVLELVIFIGFDGFQGIRFRKWFDWGGAASSPAPSWVPPRPIKPPKLLDFESWFERRLERWPD